jgi:two-component system, response regulator FlrC
MRALQEDESAKLAELGLAPITINILADLRQALAHAQVVVVRLLDSLELFTEVKQLIKTLGYDVPVVCRVERRNLSLTVQAMQHGALHVVAADDWSAAAWRNVSAALTRQQTEHAEQATAVKTPKSAVFVDPASQHLLALAQRVAQTDVTALLVGPTGSGKEVLARVLHESSTRAKAPFVALNCAALPEHLIEDLLFGHDKGAFTGAMKEHKGLFEQAQGGTIFLDEIGEMPMTLQSKLLRVLQERTLTRLGAQTSIALNVRVIAATNKDLRVAMQAREFREDLYFRISTFRLSLLPLAERPGDILPLVAQMLVTHGQPGLAYNLDEQAQSQLLNYPWPGNVRELENVVQRAVVLCANGLITAQHLLFDDYQNDSALHAAVLQPHGLPAASSQMGDAFAPSVPATTANTAVVGGAFGAPMSNMAPTPSSMPADLQDAMKQSEHQVIAAALQSTDSRMAAAKVLGISPRTLRYKLAQLRERGVSLAGASL